MKQTILVVGASGTVGSQIVRLLKAEGHVVRATTTKRSLAPGQVYLNVATGEGIKEAFRGVDRAFLLSPPGFADHYQVLVPLIQEAKRQTLKKVVLMTALGANAVETTPFRRAEVELEKSGLSYNIIRPNWFMQNFNTFWALGIKENRKILLPAGQAKVSFIDANDISAVAVRLLTEDKFSNQAFDLTGPVAVDHQQVAATLTETLGKKVLYEEIPPQALQQGLLTAGLPADYVDFMLLIFSSLREGYNAGVTGDVQKILDRPPMTLQSYAQNHKQAWI